MLQRYKTKKLLFSVFFNKFDVNLFVLVLHTPLLSIFYLPVCIFVSINVKTAEPIGPFFLISGILQQKNPLNFLYNLQSTIEVAS